MIKKEKGRESVIAMDKKTTPIPELVTAKNEKQELADELTIVEKENADRAAELVIAKAAKAKRAAELVIANIEKAKREDELVIANSEKAEREAELVIANEEKAKRAAELVIANSEKAKRAAEFIIANTEKATRSAELIIENLRNENSAVELITPKKKLTYQNEEKAIRAAEMVIASKELVSQKSEKSKREAALLIANLEKAKRKAEFVIANIEKAKRSAELVVTNRELVLATEKAKLIAELITLNKSLIHQIEKRKQTELELKESNEKYSKAFQSSPYAITISRLEDGGYIEINDNFVSMSGFTRKEALSSSETELNIWVDKEERNSVISALLSGKDVKGKEFQFRKKNGAIMTGLFFAKIISINEKHYMLSSIDNITEHRKVEDLLKENENKAILIMENSADAIFVTNQKGEYISTNKEVSAMLGYTSEEMKGKTIAELTNPSRHEEIFKAFNQVLNEGKSYTEIEFLKKDGNFILTDLNAVLLPDGTVYGSCRDITERKKAELELIDAKEKAEQSNRLKTAFLQNVSHEIRTPMNGILGFSELLKKPNLTREQQQKFISVIGESGERMLRTINNIMDISKIEAGLKGVYISKSDINKQIESLYNFFAPMAESKGIQLSFHNSLPLNEAILKTDDEKISSILTNLVNNAIKYTDEGSIKYGYEKKGEFLEFFVKDTGIGIPKDRMDAIFDRFIQADITDSRAYQGSGLGLTISKSYVEMLGGEMWVESQKGLGSTFYFTIPYTIESEEKL